ncbi:hypothetical protein [Emticicia sp.]|uniref:hypothetical protein n=1 Tax=Emticicia sp. TaxID=1930953 RepID=UPI003753563F
MKNLFLLFFLLNLSSCGRDFPQHFTINGNSDTTLIVFKAISNRTFMTIRLKGKIDNDCLISLQQNNIPDSLVLKCEFLIKKGIVNDTIGKGDLYDNSAKIIFKHGNNKTGKLNLEVEF